MMATPKPIRILSVRRIIEAIMLRRFLRVFVIVWLQAAPALAADSARDITQYAHTHQSAKGFSRVLPCATDRG